ncbi:MAG: nuoJ [Gammaproteobacteria bacterium]|jgi:NADH-quinone oxidoreductase subunit J|nr:nuoJ [Gammaproteobacteria bacterium]
MIIEKLVFYVFSALLIGSATMVIVSKHSVRAAFFLIVSFCASAVLWMLLEAEFLALLLIFVYVGAVMTLFMFVVMMLNLDKEAVQEKFVRYLPFAVIVVALMVAVLVFAVKPTHLGDLALATSTHQAADYSNTKALGILLYTHYVYAFELAAVILLIAIVASIGLTHREKANNKRQRIALQLEANKHDRLEVITDMGVNQ